MSRLHRAALLGIVLTSTLAACGGGGSGGGSSGAATPPTQPTSGPGGSSYAYAGVVESVHGSGVGAYTLLEPATPGTGTHPLVVFLHGYGALTVEPYRPWLEHLARRGNVVVYPAYQTSLLTPPSTYTDNASGAVQAALTELAAGGHALVDTARAGIAGHSFGGVLAANLAAQAAMRGLPRFGALLCALPGTGGFPTYADYATIPAGTLLLAVVGEDDGVVGDTDAKRIFLGATAVPVGDKDFLTLRRDAHGSPPLLADHGAPTCMLPLGPDDVDWRGFWKWFDALLDAAFTGANRDLCLGNTPAQRDLGLWSDGVPVVEPLVTDAP